RELKNLRDWQEVANVTLLARPLRIEQFHGVVRSCLRDRRRQYVVRRLLERLHDRGRDLRQLADAMPQMVFVVDSFGSVEFLHRRAVDYLRLQRNRPGGVLSSIDIHADDFPRVEQQWNHAIALRVPLQCEFRVRNRLTGEYRWQLMRGEPAMGGDGSIGRWYV